MDFANYLNVFLKVKIFVLLFKFQISYFNKKTYFNKALLFKGPNIYTDETQHTFVFVCSMGLKTI